ncbi:MAG: hypothetical protein CTY19_17400 [Methylomonas sp.]|nr:MAG: hypothetical protein CTY19_17400 [Methylomonas sp.]
MNRLPETVNQQFNQLLAAICYAMDDVKIESAEASLIGDFTAVVAKMNACKSLQMLEMELKACLKRFEETRPSKPIAEPVRNQTRQISRKAVRGKLRVKLGDKIIEQSTVSDTFVQTLAELGLEKVAKLNKKLSGIALLARTPANGGYQTQKYYQGWYVTTHFNTPTAMKILQDVGRELRMPILVETIIR